MDAVTEIKARLPIEELVAQYCQLTKKGKSFKAICPFHSDKDPSLLISPDKGIAYCFACQTGGDIFSFYQAIEGVDFPHALKDLAEKCGVQVTQSTVAGPKKDEKDRARECLGEAQRFYRDQLTNSKDVLKYLKGRGVTDREIEEFQLGVAPDSFSQTYEYLLKAGFSRSEITLAGLAVQKELEGKMYDYFRGRLMVPIHNRDGHIIGFGGRTLKDDDAKYINSPDSALYRKSQALFSVHRAKETMRDTKEAFLVEGYFDVMACWRLGVINTVAQCGTALTQEHVRLLKRSVETVIFALDQDRAGREAAERAFVLCAKEGLHVKSVTLPQKDPADLAKSDPKELVKLLQEGGVPYLDLVLKEIAETDLQSAQGKRKALDRVSPLISSLSTSVERDHYMKEVAKTLGTTDSALKEDIAQFETNSMPSRVIPNPNPNPNTVSPFSKSEIALGLLLMYPQHRVLIADLIPPDEEFASTVYRAMKEAQDEEEVVLSPEISERANILQLFCEKHGFGDWSQSLALREIKNNILHANRELLHIKQRQIADKLLEAQKSGKTADQQKLQTQYLEVLKLSKLAG